VAQPQWITDAGSLGVIPEGVFYSVPVQATAGSEDVFFRLIAGELPAGIQVTTNGMIEGTPRSIVKVQGVPQEVSEDITSKFAIRAYTVRDGGAIDRIADRTFSITVTGQDVPEFLTPAGQIGIFFDGTKVRIPIRFTDSDPDDNVRIRLLSGELPPGLAVDPRTGVISGIIRPLIGPPGTALAGYDASPYDQFSYDFATRSATRNFQFSLEITDGKASNVRVFDIFVYAKSDMQASVTTITADNTWLTADVTPDRVPVLLNEPGFIGRYRSDNWFAYKFDAIDFDGDPVAYEIAVGNGIGYDSEPYDVGGFDRGGLSLPPGLEIDEKTGWFYGYIPDQGATEQTYQFGVRVYKANDPAVGSPFFFFTITIIGDINTEILWLTDPDLGTIANGGISTFAVRAVNPDRALQYRIASGTNSRLPQGLTLQPSGNITGRVSFNTFALDGGTTTFDAISTTRLAAQETTFDSDYSFTVNAFSPESAQISYRVGAINVIEGGSNYNRVTATFSAPLSGTTAQGIVTLVNGFITEIEITNPGSGYVTPPTVSFSPLQSGTAAVTSVSILDGQVTGVNIVSTGSAYPVPLVELSAPPNQLNSIQATAGDITIVDGVITEIAVGNPGAGYITIPTVTITAVNSGSGAVASATIQDLSEFDIVSVFRRFTIRVRRVFNTPYEKLYIKCMPPFNDRALISGLVQNQDIIPVSTVYRADDPNFGVATSVVYDHAYGLAPASLDTYVESLDINHYWKNVTLGNVRTARALDSRGNVLYEVVYSPVIDNLVNDQGQSVSKEITLPYPVTSDDNTVIDIVYPNSLINMRDQVISTVGQISPALPLWMTSKQANGQVLGFTPAWVIAYVQPGASGLVAYNIREKFQAQLNVIDFKIDRYEIDRSQTWQWDNTDDEWEPQPPAATTFDTQTAAPVFATWFDNSGDPVTWVNNQSVNVIWETSGSGIPQQGTFFDGGSTRFITPTVRWIATDSFDKYLVFPRRDILSQPET